MEEIFEPEYLYDHGVRRSQRREVKDVIEGYVSSDEGEILSKYLELTMDYQYRLPYNITLF